MTNIYKKNVKDAGRVFHIETPVTCIPWKTGGIHETSRIGSAPHQFQNPYLENTSSREKSYFYYVNDVFELVTAADVYRSYLVGQTDNINKEININR